MTDEQLANLRRLADAATPGPWAVEREYPGRDWSVGYVYLGTGMDNQEYTVTTCSLESDELCGAEQDAAFIAAARQAVPELLDALAAMTQRAEAAEAKLTVLLGADKPNKAATPTQIMRHWMLIASEQKRRAEAAEHQLRATPWRAIRGVIMHQEELEDWTTVHNWLHVYTPQQEAQP